MKNINIELKYFKLVKPINASMEDIIKNTINKVASKWQTLIERLLIKF